VQRVAAMIQKYQEGVIGKLPETSHDVGEYHAAIADCRFDRAMEAVWVQVRGLNQYIEEEKPWSIAKEGDDEHLQEVLADTVASLLEIAELLVPFLPETAAKITAMFTEGVVRPLKEQSLFPRQED